MSYSSIATIVLILLVILFLMVKPLIGERDNHQKRSNSNELVDLYFNKLIDQELNIESESVKEYLTATEIYRVEIIAQLRINQNYAYSSIEEQEFIFLVKKKEQITRYIKKLEASYYLNGLESNTYETRKASLAYLLKKTEDEIAPFIA